MSALTIHLDERHAGLLAKLTAQSGYDARTLIEAAIEMFAASALNDSNGPPLSEEEVAAMKQALAEIERDEGISHEQVVAETRAEFER